MEVQNVNENIISVKSDPDYIRALWREVGNTASDLGHFIEDQLIEMNMPGLRIKKIDMGKPVSNVSVNPDEEIEITPLNRMDGKSWRPLEWQVKKVGEERIKPPKVSANPISAEELKHALELPRNYRGLANYEKALIFKNEDGKTVGWVAYSETSENSCHLSYIGAIDKTKGYGSSMLQYLKDRYQNIGLTASPYHTEDLLKRMSALENSFRTKKFYVRNGFVGSGGSYGWNKETPNIEDMKTGEKKTVKNSFCANGTTFWTADIMEAYLKIYRESVVPGKHLDQKTERAIDAWLRLKDEYHRLSSELDKLS